MARARSIFITNNGLTDHIGIAQILPYLQGLARLGHDITVVSVEDPSRWDQNAPPAILPSNETVGGGSLRYTPIFRKSGLLGRFQRFLIPLQMSARLHNLIAIQRPDLIHCRSYMPLSACLFAIRMKGVPLVFDVRGFWVDQRIEGGAWSLKNPLDIVKIRFFRWLESRGYAAATRIVTLTHAAKKVIVHKPSYRGAAIDVIPCSVNQETFGISDTTRTECRSALGVSKETLVVCYLGSNSGVYRMDLVYKVYAAAKRLLPSARLFLIGSHDCESHRKAAAMHGLELTPDELITRLVPHKEVPSLLNAADIGLSFQISTESSLGVSATKVGEYMACGLPVGSNRGVGDIEKIIRPGETGAVLADDSPAEIERIARILVDMARKVDRFSVKAHGRKFFSLDTAIAHYNKIYGDLGRQKDNTPPTG